MSLVRSTLAAGLAGLLAACSVSEPLVVDSSGVGLSRAGSVGLTLPQEEAGTPRGQFGAALVRAFAGQSYTNDPTGRIVADYAIAIGAASEGVVGGTVQPEQAPNWIAEPRRKRNFDECEAQRMRGTLVLLDRASGDAIYRGEASRIECDFSEADISALAEALVRDALGLTPRSPGN